ncbi:hypothetical protein ACQ86N_22505 [Puia sp. P3]|uniref:hypothetical protein n=1 Tax=Puia sp. P3 TaxID=3423952 RepID=UPI003D676509
MKDTLSFGDEEILSYIRDGTFPIIVAFSGGKDSIAMVLYLLEQGVDRRRIHLHHHDVDGEAPIYLIGHVQSLIAKLLRMPSVFHCFSLIVRAAFTAKYSATESPARIFYIKRSLAARIFAFLQTRPL